jgi:hypothetical protein
MHEDDDVDGLTPEERAALDRLPREVAPGAAFEDRVVGGLRDARLLRPSRPWRRYLWQTAAAVLLIAGGFVAGRARPADDPPTAATTTRQYLLLLYGAASATPELERARVTEYGNWARAEAAAGRLVMGERLGDARVVLGSERTAPPASNEPNGFFLIRAASFEEASRTAARCPHVSHGGTVVVRAIE